MKKNILAEYCNAKLWLLPSRELPFWKRVLLQSARILILTGLRFTQNQCMVKAASLTFYTLLSIIPILALAFGIAKGLGMAHYLTEKLRLATAQYPEMAEKLLTFADSTLKNTQGGIIAGAGVLLLIWSAVKLLSNIESNLNEIWGIRQGRTLVRKITDYVTILMICPILLLTSGSVLIFASTHMNRLIREIPCGEYFMPVLHLSNTLLPLLIVWLVFTFIYIAIPNTKVNILPALLGGLVSAGAYTFLQSAYIFAQFTTANLNAIYGSFAALPLFLIWLNLSWIIILGGAQLVFSIQNVNEYEMLPVDGLLSQQQKYIYSMQILALLSGRFRSGNGVLSDQEISSRLKLPIRTVRQLLFDLAECRLLLEIAEQKRSALHYYQVAKDPEKITPALLLESLENLGNTLQVEREEDRTFRQFLMKDRFRGNASYNMPLYQWNEEEGERK